VHRRLGTAGRTAVYSWIPDGERIGYPSQHHIIALASMQGLYFIWIEDKPELYNLHMSIDTHIDWAWNGRVKRSLYSISNENCGLFTRNAHLVFGVCISLCLRLSLSLFLCRGLWHHYSANRRCLKPLPCFILPSTCLLGLPGLRP